MCEALSTATKASKAFPKAKWHIQHMKILLEDLSECLSTQVSFGSKQAGHFYDFKFTSLYLQHIRTLKVIASI